MRKKPAKVIPHVKCETEAREIIGWCDEVTKYLDSLEEFDRKNFIILVNLPDAERTLSRCPDEKMKVMGLLCLKLKKLGVEL